MRVAIAGAGKVGTYIAGDLRKHDHDVLLIDNNFDLVNRLRETLDVTLFYGDCCEVSALHEAGIEGVDVMVAATGDDEDNLVVSLLAKQEFAVPRVIARVNHPKNHWLFNESWGVDVAVSTPHLLTSLVEEAVSVGSLVQLLTFEGGGARLVEVTLSDKSPAVNQTVAELGVPRDASLVAVVRGGHVVVPRGDTVLLPGDEVLALLVSTEAEGQLTEILVEPKVL
jgi:trk system potassium uptake protein TrkA